MIDENETDQQTKNSCCRSGPAWRISCCDCFSDRFERASLLFEDRSLEAEYMRTRTPASIVVIPLVLSIVVIWDAGSGLVWLPTNFSAGGAPFYSLSPIGGVFSIATFVLFCLSRCYPRVRYQLVGASIWMTGVSIAIFLLVGSMSIYAYEFTVCAENFIPTEFHYTGPTSYILQYSQSFRICALCACSPTVTLIAVAWVLQKVLVIGNIASARVLTALIPFNVLMLIGMCCVAFYIQLDTPKYERCTDRSTFSGQFNIIFEMVFGIVVASGALLWAVLRKAAATRELFFWTRRTKINISQLEKEANPFHPDNLRRWIKQVQNDSLQSAEQDDDFWSIPAADLKLEAPIAAGGGGKVWRATYRNDETVAAKQIYGLLDGGNIDGIAHEAALLGQLEHPHIVKFLGICKMAHPQHPTLTALYIVQECCHSNVRAFLLACADYGDYAAWLPQAVRVATETASAMAYLHSRDIVHRDLKPENILLAVDGSVRICDFGVSSQRGAIFTSTLVTEEQLEAAVGTREYMAPEAFLHFLNQTVAEVVGAAVDVYAFGIILWELFYDWTASIDAVAELQNLAQYETALLSRVPVTLQSLLSLWELPSLDCVHDACPKYLVSMLGRCWKLIPGERPSFAAIEASFASQAERWSPKKSTFNNTHVQESVPHRTLAKSALGRMQGSPRSDLHLALLDDHLDVDGGHQVRTSRASTQQSLLSSVSTFATPESAAHGTRRLSCNSRLFMRYGLHFDSVEAEQKFDSYVHGDDFYSVLKWPFVVCAVAYGVLTAVSIYIDADWYCEDYFCQLDFLFPIISVVLFSTAASFGWLPHCRKHSNTTLLAITLTRSIVKGTLSILEQFRSNGQFELTWFDNSTRREDPQTHGFNGTEFSKGCLVFSANGTHVPPSYFCWNNTEFYKSYSCIETNALRADDTTEGSMQFAVQYSLFFWENLTVPVILMLLGLPFRLYVYAIAVPAIFLVVKLGMAFAMVTEYNDMPTSSLGYFMLSAIFAATLIMYTSCFLSVYTSEKSRRKLFILYSALQSQEVKLTRDASFRRYRQKLQTNRELLVKLPEATGSTRRLHVVTSVSVN